MLDKEKFAELYEKFFRNECNEKELLSLVDAIAAAQDDEDEAVSRLFDKTWEEIAAHPKEGSEPESRLQLTGKSQDEAVQMWLSKKRIIRRAAAACLIFLLGAGAFMWLGRSNAPVLSDETVQIQLSPESNKATLILADGTAIALSAGKDAVVAVQGNVQVLQENNGIVYKANGTDEPAPGYNILTTPRGGQYKLTLPDGSRAWLNAAASIRFPVSFTGASREVEVSGEVYFEVQKNSTQPFIVYADSSRTEALGTRFDVKAYADEPSVSVTLIEGSIRFSGGRFQQILKPSQQAQFDKKSGTGNVEEADVANAVAWLRGELPLSGLDLETLMREISRWYDVDVEIKTKLQQRQFQGILKRTVSLPDVLAALDANGVDTKLEGRKLIVSMK